MNACNCTNQLMARPYKFTSAQIVSDKTKVTGLHLLADANYTLSLGQNVSVGAESVTVMFEENYQPIGLFGTGSSGGVNSLGFVSFSAKCESDRKTQEQLEKLLNTTEKEPAKETKKIQTGVIYIVLVIIGTAIVLLAIIVVLIVLIKQMRSNREEQDNQNDEAHINKKKKYAVDRSVPTSAEKPSIPETIELPLNQR